jgi:hypothetical protein
METLSRSESMPVTSERTTRRALGHFCSGVSDAVRRFGVAGCVSRMAQEFGDHPEAAARRMRWIRQFINAPSAAACLRGTEPDGSGLAPRSTQPATGGARRAA